MTAAYYDGSNYKYAVAEDRLVVNHQTWIADSDPMSYMHDNPFIMLFGWSRTSGKEFSFQNMTKPIYWNGDYKGSVLQEDADTVLAQFETSLGRARVTFSKALNLYPIQLIVAMNDDGDYKDRIFCTLGSTTETVVNGLRAPLPDVISYQVGEKDSYDELEFTYQFSNYRINQSILETKFHLEDPAGYQRAEILPTGGMKYNKVNLESFDAWNEWHSSAVKAANQQFKTDKAVNAIRNILKALEGWSAKLKLDSTSSGTGTQSYIRWEP